MRATDQDTHIHAHSHTHTHTCVPQQHIAAFLSAPYEFLSAHKYILNIRVGEREREREKERKRERETERERESGREKTEREIERETEREREKHTHTHVPQQRIAAFLSAPICIIHKYILNIRV